MRACSQFYYFMPVSGEQAVIVLLATTNFSVVNCFKFNTIKKIGYGVVRTSHIAINCPNGANGSGSTPLRGYFVDTYKCGKWRSECETVKENIVVQLLLKGKQWRWY